MKRHAQLATRGQCFITKHVEHLHVQSQQAGNSADMQGRNEKTCSHTYSQHVPGMWYCVLGVKDSERSDYLAKYRWEI